MADTQHTQTRPKFTAPKISGNQKPLDLIQTVKTSAMYSWANLLPACGIDIPAKGKHGACPVCGGTDRFHFIDDHHHGNWHCRQCDAPNYGDGLDLVAKTKGISITEAAKVVANVLALPLPESKPAKETHYPTQPIAERVAALMAQTVAGQSPYLAAKGLQHLDQQLLFDNSTVLALTALDKKVAGAQIIKPNGEKKYFPGSQTKGAFIPVSELEAHPDTVIITEGYATALTVNQLYKGTVLAALDAGNLYSVAKAVRERWPDAKIIIAADNDWHLPGELDKHGKPKVNIGKISAEKAAIAVNGWITLPPDAVKADWDDYRQHYGIEAAKQAFSQGLYQVGKSMNSYATENRNYHNVETLYPQRKTKLPLSVGSEGFDAQLDYVVKGIIPANSLCSIYGASGSYKSFLAGAWGCHIATGKAWAGKAVAQGSVLYVVGEGGIGVPRRIKAWEIVNGQVVKNMYLINTPVFPASPAEVHELVIAAQQVESETGEPVRLIILDTLARCFGGADENDSKDMGAFVRGCDELKAKTGASILVVHHSGKDESKGARGSSAFRAALDVEYRISREGKKGGALVMTCTKMKDAEEPETKAYDMRVVELFTDKDGEDITSLVLVDRPRDPVEEEDIGHVSNKTDNHTALWQCIRSRTALKEPCSIALVRDDLKAIGVNVKNFSRWLTKLEQDGLIARNGQELTIINQNNED
ncbi:AAA family ATPase [Xenorhabdus griffiniae]|uniref:AAA family ATPase n=1 Tax=Xenorhabdus griffiniae TaxID=351672 RepID=A0ABY9XEX4_9GAMM|nr:AAA family ATPase [Xenorhabdus griffiniae]MBD1225959.1 AAA family ATPase [Xenorhabdus griffiniae]MBE8585923.1 AAA family ATPase [Xenorhabdus griffiniae]WMV71463.1 AAA family ATPase [Xenorhabdus griffiniae]WNH01140.1 AAA family ATPase [Xenorhabdus griffiniae]